METGWLGELYRNGYNLPEIGVFYGMAKEYGRVTITNMQSLSKVAIELFDIVIFDECFSGDTNVTVRINNKNKNIKIKKIVNKKIFCEVLSYNINKNKYEYKSILKHYQIKEKRKVMKIILEDNTKIILTPEQLIYNGNNYIKANKLKKGNFIQCLEKKK